MRIKAGLKTWLLAFSVFAVAVAVTGCSFAPKRSPISINEARSIVSQHGYQVVLIGMTIDRLVDERTFYGIYKDATGNEYAYEIVTKTKDMKTIRLGIHGFPTWQQMQQRLIQQGNKKADVARDLGFILSKNDTFYWQFRGYTWNLNGEPMTVPR